MRSLLLVLLVACQPPAPPSPPKVDCPEPPKAKPVAVAPKFTPELPLLKARYETYKLGKEYVGESERVSEVFGTKVKYFDPLEREASRAFAWQGKLIDRHGKLLDPDLKTKPDRDGESSYAMDAAGNLYLTFDHTPGYIHHSSMLGGMPVACAGILKVEQGVVKLISNYSGHYKPPHKCLDHLAARLREMGIDTKGMKIERIGSDGKVMKEKP